MLTGMTAEDLRIIGWRFSLLAERTFLRTGSLREVNRVLDAAVPDYRHLPELMRLADALVEALRAIEDETLRRILTDDPPKVYAGIYATDQAAE